MTRTSISAAETMCTLIPDERDKQDPNHVSEQTPSQHQHQKAFKNHRTAQQHIKTITPALTTSPPPINITITPPSLKLYITAPPPTHTIAPNNVVDMSSPSRQCIFCCFFLGLITSFGIWFAILALANLKSARDMDISAFINHLEHSDGFNFSWLGLFLSFVSGVTLLTVYLLCNEYPRVCGGVLLAAYLGALSYYIGRWGYPSKYLTSMRTKQEAEIFSNMGVDPVNYTYSFLISSLVESRYLKEAYGVLSEMVEKPPFDDLRKLDVVEVVEWKRFGRSGPLVGQRSVVIVTADADYLSRMSADPLVFCESEMDLFSFIHHADPTKMRIDKRQIEEGQVPLLESTEGRVIPLAGGNEQGGQNDNDEVSEPHDLNEESGGAEVGNQTKESDRVVQDEEVNIGADEGVQAAVADKPKKTRKKRKAASGASGSNLPPKKLKEDHDTSGDAGASTAGKSLATLQCLLEHSTLDVEIGATAAANVTFVTSSVTLIPEREGDGHTDSVFGLNLQTRHPAERFVIFSDFSHHSSTNAAGDEVTYIVRSSAPPPPVMTVVVAATVVVGTSFAPALGAGTEPVHASIFADSASPSAARPDTAGPSHP
ncbi:hypothetical protein Tco_0217834 [Tanacetum coccineum]